MKQARPLAEEEKVPGDPIALMLWAAAMLVGIGLVVFVDHIVTYLDTSSVICVFVLESGGLAYLNARYGWRILHAAAFPAPGSRFPFTIQRTYGRQAKAVGWCFIMLAGIFTAKAAAVIWLQLNR